MRGEAPVKSAHRSVRGAGQPYRLRGLDTPFYLALHVDADCRVEGHPLVGLELVCG